MPLAIAFLYVPLLKRSLLLISLTLSPLLSCAQTTQEHQFVYWHERSKLTWDDFKGDKVVKSEPGSQGPAAHGRVGVVSDSHQFKDIPDSVTISIKAAFDRLLSSVRADVKTDEVLSHEQLHFDMVEVVARKMRKSYALTDFNVPAARRANAKLMKSLRLEYGERTLLYDKETQGSSAKQIEWNDKIALELQLLREYAHPEIKIPAWKTK